MLFCLPPCRGLGALVVALLLAAPCAATQTVWVDFDTFTTPELPGEEDDYEYSPAEREAVLGILHGTFFTAPEDPFGGPFGIDFLDTAPPPFTSTLVKVNAGLGHADKIDFRNLDDDDDVTIHPVRLLKSFAGLPRAPEFGGGVWTEGDLLTSENIVIATANLAAHELGHSFGLRHHDSFSPIGEGIGVAGSKYAPTYLGPSGSTNAEFHVMGLNSAVALTPENLLTPSWLSPRSAVKLMINKIEDDLGDNPLLLSEALDAGGDVPDGPGPGTPFVPMSPLMIPNTTQPPDPFGRIPGMPYAPGDGPDEFPAFAGLVVGSLEDKSSMSTVDVDYYKFGAPAGAKVTVEVISHILSIGDGRITDTIDPVLEVLDATTLLPLPYPAATIVGPAAWSDDQFESTDSIVIDVEIPATGEYLVEVRPSPKATFAELSGDYEVLIYGVAEIPGPLEADFDHDGDVDEIDLGIWQTSYGVDDMADADGDGTSASFDFLVWQYQNGFSLPATATATTIPEPSTVALVLLAATAVAVLRERAAC
ncbi:MAG: hypothetical protein CMJ58_17120 [Planctomycetaceae bacterium]|nr:hypothetical protein [Planctomycetaceae bacterium]